MLSALKQQNTDTENTKDPKWLAILSELEAIGASEEDIKVAWEEYTLVELDEAVVQPEPEQDTATVPVIETPKELEVTDKPAINDIEEVEEEVEEVEELIEDEVLVEEDVEEEVEEELTGVALTTDASTTDTQDETDLLDRVFEEKETIAPLQYPNMESEVNVIGEAEVYDDEPDVDVPRGAVPIEVFYGSGDRDEKDLVKIMRDAHGAIGTDYEFSQKVPGDDVLGIRNKVTGESIQIPLQTPSTPDGDIVSGYQQYLDFMYREDNQGDYIPRNLYRHPHSQSGNKVDSPGIISTQVADLESKYKTVGASTDDWLKRIAPVVVEHVVTSARHKNYIVKHEKVDGKTRDEDPEGWEAKKFLHTIYTKIADFDKSTLQDYSNEPISAVIRAYNTQVVEKLDILSARAKMIDSPGYTTVQALNFTAEGVWPEWDVVDYLSYRSSQEQSAWIDNATALLAPVFAKWGTLERELNKKLQDKYLVPMLEEFEVEIEKMIAQLDTSEMTEEEVLGLVTQLDDSFIEELQKLVAEDEEYIQLQEDYTKDIIKTRGRFNTNFKITTNYLKPSELKKISAELDALGFMGESWRTKKLLLAHKLNEYVENLSTTGASANDILDVKREFWGYFYDKLTFDENNEATLFASKDLAENQLRGVEAWVDEEVERIKNTVWKELKNGNNPHRVWSGRTQDTTTLDLDRFNGYDDWYKWYVKPIRDGGGGGNDEVENQHGDLNRDKILSGNTVKQQTKKYAEDILNAKDTNWEDSGLSNFYSGLTSARIQEIIPLVGGVVNMTDAYRIYAITQKPPEERTNAENELLTIHSIKQSVDEIISKKSIGYNAGKMTTYSLSFMGEMALTGGAFTLTKKVVGRGIKKRLLGMLSPEHVSKIRFKPGTSQILPGFIPSNISVKVGQGLIPTFQNVDKIVSRIANPIAFLTATGAQTGISQHQILATAFEEMSPTVLWAFSDDANELVDLYSSSFDTRGKKLTLRDAEFNTWSVVPKIAGEDFEGDTGRGVVEAYTVGFGLTFTEMFTERLGFHIPGATKAALKAAGLTDEFIQRLTLGHLMRKFNITSVSALREAISEGIFWSGPAIEYLEEMIAMPLQNIITGKPIFGGIAEVDEFGYYTGKWDTENLSTIFVSIAAMGGVGGSVQLLGPKKAGQSHVNGITYKSDAKLLEALKTQLQEGTFNENVFSNNLVLTEKIEALLKKYGSNPKIVKTKSDFNQEIDKVVATDVEVISRLDEDQSDSYNETRAKQKDLVADKLTEQQSGKPTKEKVRAIKLIDIKLAELESLINNTEITPGSVDVDGNEVDAITIGDMRGDIITEKRTEIYQRSLDRVKESIENAKIGENQLVFQEALGEEEAMDQLRDFILKYEMTQNGESLPPLRAVLNKFGYWNGSVEVIGREFMTFELTDEQIEAIETKSEEARDVHGLFKRVPNNKDIPALIIINRENSIKMDGNHQGNLYVAEHEFLHFILNETFMKSPETMLAIGSGLHSHLMGIDPSQVKSKRFKERIKKYKKKQGDVVAAEETLNMFVDALNEGYFVKNSSLLTRLGDGLRRAFNQQGYEIILSEPSDVYDFLVDWNQEIGNGRLSPSMEKVKSDGLVLSGDLESFRVNAKEFQEFKQELKEAGLLFSAEEESDKVQEVYDTSGVDGKWEIAMAYEGMANSLFNKNLSRAVTEDQRNALLNNKEDIIFETLYGPTGVMKLVETYNPEVDPIVARYINKWLQKRVLKIYDRYAGLEQVSNLSISDDATLAEAEQMSGSSASSSEDQMLDLDGLPVNVILLEANIFGDQETVREEVRGAVESADIQAAALVKLREAKGQSIPKVVGQEIAGVEMIPVVDKNGKPKLNKKGEQVYRLPNKNAEVVTTGKLWSILETISERFGVDPKRVVSQQTFNTQMRRAAREFIISHQLEIRDGLPKQFTPNGDSVGLMPTVLKAFYEEIEVRGGTKAATDLGLVGMAGKGLSLWIKKDLSQEMWISEILGTGTSSDQLIKGIIKQLATQVTIQEIKLPLEGIEPLDVLSLLGEGRGENMYSQELTDEEMQEIRTQAGNLADPIGDATSARVYLANLPVIAKLGVNLTNPEEVARVIETEFAGYEGITGVSQELALKLASAIGFIESVNGSRLRPMVEEANAVIEHRDGILSETSGGDIMLSEEFENILGKGEADLDSDLNLILETTKGVERQKEFSAAKARLRGKNKGRFKFFIPPSADDFAGLMYAFLGKGKIGEEQHEWFKRNLFDPYARGIRNVNNLKQIAANDAKSIKNAFPEANALLSKSVVGVPEFNYEHAVRVYNWAKNGIDIPGLSKTDKNILIQAVESNKQLRVFTRATEVAVTKAGGYTKLRGPAWLAGNIHSDVVDALGVSRKTYLGKWQENVDVIFSEKNLNKVEAVYGTNYREALEDVMYRMKTGASRPVGQNKIMNGFVNWINGSVGTTMFFNGRSAVLQMISNVNFLNFEDNNLVQASKAFADQKQYWADVSMIFNSDFLKQRRSGLQTDINASELMADIENSKNAAATAIGHLLRIGFTPTQIADSFAIATGGATMYRNRVNSLLKSGSTQAEAENEAFIDMMEIAEETQQSARPDKVSMQQASPLGKIVLAFQNTPMQYNRIIKKAALDLVNGRGDAKEHIAKIAYYGGIQNMLFYGLQTALFAFMFDGDEEKEGKALERSVNGMVDTILRGTGVYGAVISTVKNVIIKTIEENEKLNDEKFGGPNWGNVVVEALNISPPIGIKARKLQNSLKTWEFNQDLIDHMDKTDFDNPMWEVITAQPEVWLNMPMNRIYHKVKNVRASLDADNELWKRVHAIGGWSSWSLGLEPRAIKEAKIELGEIKVIEKEEKKAQNKIKREIKEEKEAEILEEGFIEDQKQERENEEEKVTCAKANKLGVRCSLPPVGSGKFCTVHQEVKQNATGEKIQCAHIKDNGKRCGVMTSNASKKCYYHD